MSVSLLIRTMSRAATVLLLCFTAGVQPGMAAADVLSKSAFDIAPQPLPSALLRFSEQSGVQVTSPGNLIEGKESNGVVGTFDARGALDRILKDTHLGYDVIDRNTVLITSPPAASATGPQTSAAGPESSTAATSPATASESPQESARVELEEIVVSAQKRQERLIDVPQSVTVVSGDALARHGATQFRDFAASVPGLSFQSEGAGLTQISLRGVTVGKDAGATVGIYVDDVPYGSSSTFARGGQVTLDVGLFDLDRIEVLRGPQGTLYGASTMGGLIKYVTKRPNSTRLEAQLQAGVTNTHHGGNGYDVAASVNAPVITDELAIRASGYSVRDGGYMDNIALNRRDVGRSDTNGGRVDLLYAPTEKLSIRLGGFLQDISRDGFPIADFTLAGAVRDELQQRRLVSEPFDQKFRLANGTVSYDFGPITLTSISSYQTSSTQFVVDVSSSLAALCSLQGGVCSTVALHDDTRTDKFTQELRLGSEAGGPLTWLIGAYYTRETSSFNQDLALADAAGESLPNNLLGNVIPSRYKEAAAFGHVTWHLSRKFDVSGGIRYAGARTTFAQTGSGILGRSAPATSTSSNVFTYLADASCHLSDHQAVYARYATGYRPGGPNFLVLDPATGRPFGPPTFDADRLKSYEAGFKAETAEGRLGVDLSAYHIDWNDIIITASAGPFNSRANAPGGASVDGSELSLIARPARSLSFAGTFAYVDATVTDAVAGLRATAGQRLPTVPRFAGSLNADYEAAVRLQPSFGVSVSYVGDRPASFGSPAYDLPEYTTVNLRAGITIAATQVQLYANNIFDGRGQLAPRVVGANTTSSLTVPFLVSIQQPRTVGLMVSARF